MTNTQERLVQSLHQIKLKKKTKNKSLSTFRTHQVKSFLTKQLTNNY